MGMDKTGRNELERNFLKEKGENTLEVAMGRKDNLWLPHFSYL